MTKPAKVTQSFLRALPIWKRRPLLLALFLLVAAGLAGAWMYYWPETYLHAARSELAGREYEQARGSLERYLVFRPKSSEAHLLLAQIERRMNNYDEAAGHLADCRRLGGPSDAIELEYGLNAIQNGTYNAALDKLCEDNMARADSNQQYLILEALSQGLTKTYRLKEALVCLNRMLVLQPDSAYALRRRAWICSQFENHDQADVDYRRALEIDANDTVARLGLAQILLTVRKRYSEAAEHFEQLWAVERNAAVALGLAQSWRQVGRGPEACRLLDDWLEDHPGDAAALAERGRLALDDQDVQEGEKMLRRALALAPYLVDTYYTLYLCLSRQGRAAEAQDCEARMQKAKEEGKAAKQEMEHLTRKLQATPDDADLRCRIAQLFLRYGEEEGLRWLLLNVKNHPGHRPSHQALAEYYQKAGQSKLAEEQRRLAGM
jgi:tetratricopeptide (TPR) repeat protein